MTEDIGALLLALCFAGLYVWICETIDAFRKRSIKWIAFSLFAWTMLIMVLYAFLKAFMC